MLVFFRYYLRIEWSNVSDLKGVCHEIFDLRFFSWFQPIWAPDKQAEVFSNSVSISPRYSITKFEKSTPRCASHRGVKILVLAIPKNFLQIFSYMIE